MLCLLSVPLIAADEFTLYELLPPETHQFAITYDVTARAKARSSSSIPSVPARWRRKRRVIERSSGKELKFEVVNGKDAKADRTCSADTPTKPNSSESICRGRCRKVARRASASSRLTRMRLLITLNDGQAGVYAAAGDQAQRGGAAKRLGAGRVRVAGDCFDGCGWTNSRQLPQRSRRSVAGKDRCAEAAMRAHRFSVLLLLAAAMLAQDESFIAPSRTARSATGCLSLQRISSASRMISPSRALGRSRCTALCAREAWFRRTRR